VPKYEIDWTLNGRMVVEAEAGCTSEQLWEGIFGKLEGRPADINQDILFDLGTIELSTDVSDPQLRIREVGSNR
jgi:hypothetical protein